MNAKRRSRLLVIREELQSIYDVEIGIELPCGYEQEEKKRFMGALRHLGINAATTADALGAIDAELDQVDVVVVQEREKSEMETHLEELTQEETHVVGYLETLGDEEMVLAAKKYYRDIRARFFEPSRFHRS